MSSTLIVQLDMRTLCQEADVTADCVIEIVEHGIV